MRRYRHRATHELVRLGYLSPKRTGRKLGSFVRRAGITMGLRSAKRRKGHRR